FTSFEVQHALGIMAMIKLYLENLIERSNHTRAQNVPPEVTVFPRGPVELGEPNVLICFVDKFFPPVLHLTWLKNGQEDNSFRKFSYLPFLPSPGDFYDCRVEHWGLPEPFTKHWGEAGAPGDPAGHRAGSQGSILALGGEWGLVGQSRGHHRGTILIIKGMKMNTACNPRGPL
uniref:Ig-like domain-containing protein n=1 Tax=Terrapene triunguis TaxID=2587831 RepID=A0A674JLI9_9SAUR